MKSEEVKEILKDLILVCADHTLKTLTELSQDKSAQGDILRATITPMLISAWQKMPISLGMPRQLKRLEKWYNNRNMYTIEAGKIIDMMLIIKEEDSVIKNLN